MNTMRIHKRLINALALYCLVSPLIGAQAQDWQIQLSAGQANLDYQENDNAGLTPDGVLNSETGATPMATVSLIHKNNLLKHSDNRAWTPYGRLDFQYARGDSDYDGYLQSGDTLSPYQTTTDNRIWQADIALGAQKPLTDTLSITPTLNLSHRQWQRQLQQYQEDFKHTALLAGIAIDWQPLDNQPMLITASGQVGRTLNTQIDVPELGLKQSIGHAKTWQLGVEGQYQFSNDFSVNAGVSHREWQYKESAVENGYQYPDSESAETQWHVGLGYVF